MRKEVVDFDTKDIIEIEKIVLDNDKEKAFEYLKKIYKMLKEREKSHCKSSFAWEKGKDIPYKK